MISGLVSPAVALQRLHFTRIAAIGRRRNVDGGLTPSILDYSYPKYQCQQQRLIVDSTNTSSTGTNNCHFLKSNCIVDTRLLLLLSIKSNTDIVDKNDKLNKTNTIGWLRINENINKQSTTTKDIHLMLEEKKLLKLVMGFKHLKCYWAINKIAYAWGVSQPTVHRLIKNETLVGGNLEQKIRNDKGLTVFNSERSQQSTFTTYYVFKKVKRLECRGERLSNAQVYSSWLTLSDAEMYRFEELSEQQKERCAFLLVEIGEILKRTQGRLVRG